MTVATILSDTTRTVDGAEEHIVRYEAPTTEAGWLELFESLIGTRAEAQAAYANMLTAIADDESTDEDVFLWDAEVTHDLLD